MNKPAATNLRIDPERLWGDLMETARIGGTAKGGICRLTLTDLDRQVRDELVAGRRHLFEAEMKEDRRTRGRRGHEARPVEDG